MKAIKDGLTAAHMHGFYEGQGQYRDKVRKLQDDNAALKEKVERVKEYITNKPGFSSLSAETIMQILEGEVMP